MVPQSERPSLWAQGKLTRQAWVSQWQAPGRKLLWVYGRLSSCSCMTLTTATTRQAILLLLSEAMLLWYDACIAFRGTEENSQCVFGFMLVAVCMHVHIQYAYAMLHMCMIESLLVPVCMCLCQDSELHASLGRREEWPLLLQKMHTGWVLCGQRMTP